PGDATAGELSQTCQPKTGAAHLSYPWSPTNEPRLRAPALSLSVPAEGGVISKPLDETVQFRCLACGHGVSVTGDPAACPACGRQAWQRLPIRRATEEQPVVDGTMLWFDESKDYGFILTDDGERLYVD